MNNDILTTLTNDALKDISKVQELLDSAFEAIKEGDNDKCLELLDDTTIHLTNFDNFLDEFSTYVNTVNLHMKLMTKEIKKDSVSS